MKALAGVKKEPEKWEAEFTLFLSVYQNWTNVGPEGHMRPTAAGLT